MHGVDIQGTVVIVCEESASFDITSNDLAFCIADVQSILEYMMKEHLWNAHLASSYTVEHIAMAVYSFRMLYETGMACIKKISINELIIISKDKQIN